jgi:adenylate kinase
VRRSDDNAETVKNRLMAYYRETAPLIGYYFAKGKLKSVDGMAPISDVASQIEVILAGSTGP